MFDDDASNVRTIVRLPLARAAVTASPSPKIDIGLVRRLVLPHGYIIPSGASVLTAKLQAVPVRNVGSNRLSRHPDTWVVGAIHV